MRRRTAAARRARRNMGPEPDGQDAAESVERFGSLSRQGAGEETANRRISNNEYPIMKSESVRAGKGLNPSPGTSCHYLPRERGEEETTTASDLTVALHGPSSPDHATHRPRYG